MSDPVTAPTPDAVAQAREALVRVLSNLTHGHACNLAGALGVPVHNAESWPSAAAAIADALLAAVSRPAEARGEAVTPEMVKVALDEADRDLREGETFASALAASLNRQLAAPRPEPGEPSEAMVWAMVNAEDGSIGYERCKHMLRAALAAHRVTP